VFKPFRALPPLLILVAAGCASHPLPQAPRASDWEAEDAASARLSAPVPVAPPAQEQLPSPSPLPTPKTPPVVEPKETWVAVNRWCRSQSLPIPTLLAMAPLPTFELKSTGGSLILRGGSRIAYWEGMDIRLGYAPHLSDGQLFVHSLDVTKTISPLLCNAPLSCLRSNSVLVIDPGHGGENAGTKSVLGSRYEKEFTLDWARRLQSLLLAKGWQVYLTHSGDTDLALSNRVAFAEAHKAALFISLHFNSAAPDEGEAGLETYILTPAGMPSTVTRGFSDNLGQSFPNNNFDAQNLQFAARIHREILAVNGHRDRGVRRARFLGVLRNQQRPALLIEGGYLSNPAEARLIATPAFRQNLADAVARSLEGDSLAANQN
jgi:N-acetylmuramoyl-L-alanine amidase